MEISFTPNDRGQVGIGTLIVFIAMVLVAAIAAGVLINTAGFLQTQAEDTGTESTEQVANNLNIITTVGEVSPSGDTVDELRLGVQPAAGSDDLNLEEVSVQYVSDNSFSNLVHVQESDVNGAGTVFNTEAVTAEDGTDNVMTDNSDRYEVVVPHAEDKPFVQKEAYDLQDANGDDQLYSFDVVYFADGTTGESDVTSALGVDSSNLVDVEVTSSEVDQLDKNSGPGAEDIGATLYDTTLSSAAVSGEDDFSTDVTNVKTDTGTTDNQDPANAVRVTILVEDVDETALEGYDDTNTRLESGFIGHLDNSNLNELVEGEEAELTFTTESGAQTQTILQVPDSLAGEDEDDTVDL